MRMHAKCAFGTMAASAFPRDTTIDTFDIDVAAISGGTIMYVLKCLGLHTIADTVSCRKTFTFLWPRVQFLLGVRLLFVCVCQGKLLWEVPGPLASKTA